MILKVSYIGTKGKLAMPLVAIIWWNEFILAIFVEGHLMNIFARLFKILTIGFRRTC